MINIDWSNPTIVGGVFGIIGSIFGAIIGAIVTALITWLTPKGKLRVLILKRDINFTDGLIHGCQHFIHKDKWGESIIEGTKINFELLFTNSMNKNCSISNLILVVSNKKNKFFKSLTIKNSATTRINGGWFIQDSAENFIIGNNTSSLLKLEIFDNSDDLYKNYETSKYYLTFINNNGKTERIKLNFNFKNLSNELSKEKRA